MRIARKSLFIIISLILLTPLLGCSPEIGSGAWCTDMKEKAKGDWTATETGDFAKHCVFK